jgi:solute carrier family 34 (sodium-dependent phosphate cotransporter)
LETALPTDPGKKIRDNVWIVLSIVGALVLFLFALDLMVSSLQHLSRNVTETILLATANPFTALFIGLLVTAMLQSSSTTTSLVVALVASGAITLQNAIPIIMGANIGTTITSTIVALGFINRRKEFKRAVAAGTYHDFFNILTTVVLFPLEYYYGFLSGISDWLARRFFTPTAHPVEDTIKPVTSLFGPIVRWLSDLIPSPFVLALIAVIMLFCSILIFRKLISDLLKAKSPESFSRFFFKSQLKSFGWGLLTTAAIRSSTITTSVVVPIVAKKIATLRQAAPFIMGANVGTTITAFIAAALNANTSSSISIAIAHFLFNFIGVLLFFPIPVLRRLPMELASGLGKLTLKYRLVGFVYLLLTFFFIPFSLIYFNRDATESLHLTYAATAAGEPKVYYRVVTQMNKRTQSGEWVRYEGNAETITEQEPSLIHPVYVKNATLFVGDQMFLFNRPGFCWDGEDRLGKYRVCIDQVLPQMALADTSFDSVYVYKQHYMEGGGARPDHRYYYSAAYKILLQHEELVAPDSAVVREKLLKFEPQ